MWMTHHWPDGHDRCIHVGSALVCRRCAVLYPVAVLAALAVLWLEPQELWLVVGMWLLPLPKTLERVAEHRGEVEHSPTRLMWLSGIAALGIGAALAAHLRHPFDADAMAPMATHATICGVAALRAARRAAPREALVPTGTNGADALAPWEREHALVEADRDARLRGLLEDPDRGCERNE